MSVEDVNFLKENSIKQSYTFLVDSKNRDRKQHPSPNNYVVDFETPFKNIIGFEIIDASIPRTMYNVDYENNTIYYFVGKSSMETLIHDGINDNNTSYLVHSKINNTDVIENNSLLIADDEYATLSNSINIYNIYNNEENIGGSKVGISFSFDVKASAIYNSLTDNSYTILHFGYDHLKNIKNNLTFPIIIKLIKKNSIFQYFDIVFKIGSSIDNSISTLIILNQNLSNFVNICWTISNSTNENWNIYINNVKVKTYTSLYTINKVFYTGKYIGKSFTNEIGEWSGSNKLYIKNLKIYNKELSQIDVNLSMINGLYKIDFLPIWFKMDKLLVGYNNIIDNDGNNKMINYKDIFNKIIISPGDYTIRNFLKKYDEIYNTEIWFGAYSDPSDLTNLLNIYSKNPFILDMKRSTISENIGFDLNNSTNTMNRYLYKNIYENNENMRKIFHSKKNEDTNDYFITSPGIVYFIGNKYIIMKCPEIEEHLYRSLSYSNISLGLAKFRVDNIGINNEKLSITKIPFREFHPIGKLSRITLRFETNIGTLYDFKGVNHNIVIAIYYYEPTQKNFPKGSILNPEYKMNYIDYQYKQEEIEGDSDEEEGDEDFSRDNIDNYIVTENEYNDESIKLQEYNNLFTINE